MPYNRAAAIMSTSSLSGKKVSVAGSRKPWSVHRPHKKPTITDIAKQYVPGHVSDRRK